MRILKSLLLAAALVAPTLSAAQDYPNKAVTIVVPFAAGGSNDPVARFLAEELSALWGQPVVVENRPGAGTIIGTAHVAQAAPDGYTLLMVSTSLTTAAATQANLPIDPLTDLTPIGMVADSDLVVMVGNRVALPTLADLKRESDAQQIFSSTTGLGSIGHLAGLLLSDLMDVEWEFVHYNGGAPALTDMGAGRVDLFYGVVAQSQSGLATAMTVMSRERSPYLPDVPTAVESGYPDALAALWYGLFGPAGMSDDLVKKIFDDMRTVMTSPKAEEFLKAQGNRLASGTTEDFRNSFEGEITKWKALAQEHDLVVN